MTPNEYKYSGAGRRKEEDDMNEKTEVRVSALADDRTMVLRELRSCVSSAASMKIVETDPADLALLMLAERRRCAEAEAAVTGVCCEMSELDREIAKDGLAAVSGTGAGGVLADAKRLSNIRSTISAIEDLYDDLSDSEETVLRMFREMSVTEMYLPCTDKYSDFGVTDDGKFSYLAAGREGSKFPTLPAGIKVKSYGGNVYAVGGAKKDMDETYNLLDDAGYLVSDADAPLTPKEVYEKERDLFDRVSDERDELRGKIARYATALADIRAYAAEISPGADLRAFSVVVSVTADEEEELLGLPCCVVTVKDE